MDIVVFGVGAIGSVVGAFLSRMHRVTLVGRRPHMSAIRRTGLSVTGILGRHTFRGLTAVEALASRRPWDAAIVSTKSQDTARAALALRRVTTDRTVVCSFQNGLGNAEILRRTLPRNPIGQARVIFGATLVRPGQVRVTVFGAPTVVGPFPGQPEDRREAAGSVLRTLANNLTSAGLRTTYDSRVMSFLWLKVLYNSALNPLSALLGRPYGRIARDRATRRICHHVLEEGFRVARAERAGLPFRSPSELIRYFERKMIPPTAAHVASMREDLVNGRRTEIRALNGEIVRRARRHGLAAPWNGLLWRMIESLETPRPGSPETPPTRKG